MGMGPEERDALEGRSEALSEVVFPPPSEDKRRGHFGIRQDNPRTAVERIGPIVDDLPDRSDPLWSAKARTVAMQVTEYLHSFTGTRWNSDRDNQTFVQLLKAYLRSADLELRCPGASDQECGLRSSLSFSDRGLFRIQHSKGGRHVSRKSIPVLEVYPRS